MLRRSSRNKLKLNKATIAIIINCSASIDGAMKVLGKALEETMLVDKPTNVLRVHTASASTKYIATHHETSTISM